ncbi:MAG: hypothetical protein JWN25_1487 [Verrucomicrobiales bacterium]|nr:hypothetical protein [Verrucomicrobiales bacterium]
MKNKIINYGIVTGTALALMTGCVTRTRTVYVHDKPVREIVVTEAPPAATVEIRPAIPSPNHYWVPGYWIRGGNQWVWTPGHYEVKPRGYSRYVEGSWVRTRGGWVWREGHWK